MGKGSIYERILSDQQGISLLLVLIMVVVVGLSAAVAGSTWQTIVQRSKEAELLFRGDQYRRAIDSYFKSAHGGRAGQLPTDLEQLLKDPRFPEPRKHIRKLFSDPMTGGEFEPIRTGGGTIGPIRGVRSSSSKEPFKKDGFAEEYANFKDADSYQSWEFIYVPPTPTGVPKQPGQQPPTGMPPTGMPPTGMQTPTSGAIPPAGPAPPVSQPFNPLLPRNQQTNQ
jgi:type II secretory pathway pseudopilin PulG